MKRLERVWVVLVYMILFFVVREWLSVFLGWSVTEQWLIQLVELRFNCEVKKWYTLFFL